MIESTDVASLKSAANLLTVYDVNDQQIIPSYSSKIGYFNDQDFVTSSLFSKSDWEDGLNVSMDQNRLSEQLEVLNIKDILDDPKNMSPLIIDNIHTYASSLEYENSLRYLIVEKKMINSSMSEVTLSGLGDQINSDINELSSSNFDDFVVVIGISKSATSNKYTSTSRYKSTSNRTPSSSTDIIQENVKSDSEEELIGLAVVNTKKTSLHFRSSPGVREDNIISLVPKGTKVKVLKIGERDTVEDKPGYWVLVDYRSVIGYMWGGYLNVDLFDK